MQFRSTLFHSFSLAALLGAGLLFGGCEMPVAEPEAGFNAADVLTNLTDNVILASYHDLTQKTGGLAAAVGALQANPSATTLAAARQAYREARVPWETAEPWAFGPVLSLGLDAAIDTWPLNIVDLRVILNGSTPLQPTDLAGLDDGLHGFHPIEYLLFGTDGQKALSTFTTREYQFMTSTAQNLQQAAARLENAWAVDGGDYSSELVLAGPGNSLYPSQKAALAEIVEAMSTLSGELVDTKIGRPLTLQSSDWEEARFSRNSKAEFADNVRGIQNMYLGRYLSRGSGAGLATYIARRSPALDQRFRQQINDALVAIATIPGTFTDALAQNRPALEAAQAKVRLVHDTFTEEVYPLVNDL
jgi:predicted lipoprotein